MGCTLSLLVLLAFSQPCNDFNSGTDNWGGGPNIVSISTADPSDGTPYMLLRDNEGPSYAGNYVDFNTLGQLYPYTCLCFDFRMFNPGTDGVSPHYPKVTIYNGSK